MAKFDIKEFVQRPMVAGTVATVSAGIGAFFLGKSAWLKWKFRPVKTEKKK